MVKEKRSTPRSCSSAKSSSPSSTARGVGKVFISAATLSCMAGFEGDEDLAELHEREDLLLNHYSWVDQSKGEVRIPIERAMELLAQRGLPVAPAGTSQPLMTGDVRPVVTAPLTNGFSPTAYEQEMPAVQGNDVSESTKTQVRPALSNLDRICSETRSFAKHVVLRAERF